MKCSFYSSTRVLSPFLRQRPPKNNNNKSPEYRGVMYVTRHFLSLIRFIPSGLVFFAFLFSLFFWYFSLASAHPPQLLRYFLRKDCFAKLLERAVFFNDYESLAASRTFRTKLGELLSKNIRYPLSFISIHPTVFLNAPRDGNARLNRLQLQMHFGPPKMTSQIVYSPRK